MMASKQECDRSNQKINAVANARRKESKTMRQNFSFMNQGPSHGEAYVRPHTMVYKKGIKDQNPITNMMNSSMSMNNGHSSILSINEKMPYNRRRTENTVFVQDYLKAWNKVQ